MIAVYVISAAFVVIGIIAGFGAGVLWADPQAARERKTRRYSR